ncbi:hypothetical protein ACLB2K_060284 [Fragaria x ananassa]
MGAQHQTSEQYHASSFYENGNLVHGCFESKPLVADLPSAQCSLCYTPALPHPAVRPHGARVLPTYRLSASESEFSQASKPLVADFQSAHSAARPSPGLPRCPIRLSTLTAAWRTRLADLSSLSLSSLR